MVVRKPDYPPLVEYMNHIEGCGSCAKAILSQKFSTHMCDIGFALREKAREKTRWSIERNER